MISPKFIQQQAHRDKVRDSQVEKDYVLSWVLYGLSTHAWLSKSLIFKGGTVLKKVSSQFYGKVTNKLPRFRGRWQGSLSGQIHALPHFDAVIRDVGRHLRQTSKHTIDGYP